VLANRRLAPGDIGYAEGGRPAHRGGRAPQAVSRCCSSRDRRKERRHTPAVFHSCSRYWRTAHPPPDAQGARWTSVTPSLIMTPSKHRRRASERSRAAKRRSLRVCPTTRPGGSGLRRLKSRIMGEPRRSSGMSSSNRIDEVIVSTSLSEGRGQGDRRVWIVYGHISPTPWPSGELFASTFRRGEKDIVGWEKGCMGDPAMGRPSRSSAIKTGNTRGGIARRQGAVVLDGAGLSKVEVGTRRPPRARSPRWERSNIVAPKTRTRSDGCVVAKAPREGRPAGGGVSLPADTSPDFRGSQVMHEGP